MKLSLYKKYFSIEVNYETAFTTTNEDLLIVPSSSTLKILNDYNLGYRNEDGKILIFFQGLQDETDATKINPLYILDDNQSLYFKLYFTNPSLINNLNFFPDTSSMQYGFPQLYLGEKEDTLSVPVNLEYQKNKIYPGIFLLRIKDNDCGLTADSETTWQIKNTDDNIIYEELIKKDDNAYFNCSVNLCAQLPEFYSLAIGSSVIEFFADTLNEFQGCTAAIIILKNNFLPFDSDWSDTNYVKFSKTITKK